MSLLQSIEGTEKSVISVAIFSKFKKKFWAIYIVSSQILVDMLEKWT